MKPVLRFFTTAANFQHTVYRGDIKSLVANKALNEVSTVMIIDPASSKRSNKDEIKALIGVLASNPQIRSLSMNEYDFGSEINLKHSHGLMQTFSEGLKQVFSLNHLELNCTNLSERAKTDEEGMLILLNGVENTSGLKKFIARSEFIKHSVADYHPLSERSLSAIAQIATKHMHIESLAFGSFAVPSHHEYSLVKQLADTDRMPEITFDNLTINRKNLPILLAKPRTDGHKNTIPSSEIRQLLRPKIF